MIFLLCNLIKTWLKLDLNLNNYYNNPNGEKKSTLTKEYDFISNSTLYFFCCCFPLLNENRNALELLVLIKINC